MFVRNWLESDVIVGQGRVCDATNWWRAGLEREKPANDGTWRKEKRTHLNTLLIKKKKKGQYENCDKVIVKLNTSSKNLSQQSELWLAGVWGLMRQGKGGGGRGWGGWSVSVLYHQPVPHLFNRSLICDYGHQLEKDGQAYFRFNKKTVQCRLL